MVMDVPKRPILSQSLLGVVPPTPGTPWKGWSEQTKDIQMQNPAIIEIEKVVAIASYLGTTPSRVIEALRHPEVPAADKLALLSLVPAGSSKAVN
jgi:hypothetical protein